MKYILFLTIFAAFPLACATSPPPAPPPSSAPAPSPSPAPAPESLAPEEAAPIPPDVSDGDGSVFFIYPEVLGQMPTPGILPVMLNEPPPLDEEACEIYGPADDDGNLAVLAPGDPGYEPRLSTHVSALQSMPRGTPLPELEEEIARIPYFSDCLERARALE